MKKSFGVKLLNSKGIPHTERMEKIWERFIHLSRLIIMHGLTFALLRFTHHVWIPQLQVIICQCAKHEWMSFVYRIPKPSPTFCFVVLSWTSFFVSSIWCWLQISLDHHIFETFIYLWIESMWSFLCYEVPRITLLRRSMWSKWFAWVKMCWGM